jgi:hypothetical protein
MNKPKLWEVSMMPSVFFACFAVVSAAWNLVERSEYLAMFGLTAEGIAFWVLFLAMWLFRKEMKNYE